MMPLRALALICFFSLLNSVYAHDQPGVADKSPSLRQGNTALGLMIERNGGKLPRVEEWCAWMRKSGGAGVIAPFSLSPNKTSAIEPRILVAPGGEGEYGDLEGRLFLGFVPRVDGTVDVEFISWNYDRNENEYGTIKGMTHPYAKDRKRDQPVIEMVDKSACISCHKNQAGIFYGGPWQTVAHRPITALPLLGVHNRALIIEHSRVYPEHFKEFAPYADKPTSEWPKELLNKVHTYYGCSIPGDGAAYEGLVSTGHLDNRMNQFLKSLTLEEREAYIREEMRNAIRKECTRSERSNETIGSTTAQKKFGIEERLKEFSNRPLLSDAPFAKLSENFAQYFGDPRTFTEKHGVRTNLILAQEVIKLSNEKKLQGLGLFDGPEKEKSLKLFGISGLATNDLGANFKDIRDRLPKMIGCDFRQPDDLEDDLLELFLSTGTTGKKDLDEKAVAWLRKETHMQEPAQSLDDILAHMANHFKVGYGYHRPHQAVDEKLVEDAAHSCMGCHAGQIPGVRLAFDPTNEKAWRSAFSNADVNTKEELMLFRDKVLAQVRAKSMPPPSAKKQRSLFEQDKENWTQLEKYLDSLGR
jgi:hypothetical protein